jgi:hypothetical protein
MGAGAESPVHVHGGSILLDKLREAGIPGERLEWCDPVAFGPTPAGLSTDEWYRTRARYLARGTSGPEVHAAEQRLRAQDEALQAVSTEAELVIWTGPELFCQVLLIRLLVLLEDRRGSISLVDPGDQPGDPGCGLGNLGAEALRAAYGHRRPVGAEERALARRAWAAFTAPIARPLTALLHEETGALPHLAAALARHLGDLPDGATGLSTTETRLLEAVAPEPLAPGSLFAALAAREARPFLTDTLLEELLGRLGGSARPLIARDAAGRVALTDRGRDVLAGHDFWAAERWHGGIFIGLNDDEGEEVHGAN